MVQMAQVYNRPIWVTEFACGLQPNIQSLTTIMKQFLTMLDRQPMVARRAQKTSCLKEFRSEQGSAGCPAGVCPRRVPGAQRLQHCHYPSKHAFAAMMHACLQACL